MRTEKVLSELIVGVLWWQVWCDGVKLWRVVWIWQNDMRDR